MEKFEKVLFIKNSRGKWRTWEIKVENKQTYSEIITKHGLENGTQATSTITVHTGKNIGKKNETTHYTQAILDATSKYNHRLKTGYQDTKDANNTFKCMLALSFDKREKDIRYPCFVQPKIDGIRCIQKDNKLFSREGTPFSEYLDFLKVTVPENVIIDGELYSDQIPFETLVGAVKIKKQKNIPKKEILDNIKYCIFDVYFKDNPTTTFEERNNWINKHLENNVVPFQKIDNKETLMKVYQTYLDNGYEGIMIRNVSSIYKQNYRSPDLQKLKPFQDSEFEIVGYKDGIGQDLGAVIWICDNGKGILFDVKPSDTVENRKKMFINGQDFIGKWLTVKYQALNQSGVPRFANGKTLRE